MERKPIDSKRESGGSADIGTENEGAITEMTTIGNRLIIIKEKAIYESITADQIDPERTNIGLPNLIQKRLTTQGADSELVSRTFLTAKTLFKKGVFSKDIDINKTLNLTLEILEESIVLESEVQAYLDEEQILSKEYDSKRFSSQSYAVPAIANLESRCKTIIQKADHVEQILIELATVFYLNDGLNKQSHFPKLYEVLAGKYGSDDEFCKFINQTLEFMRSVRLLRNGLDHRLSTVTILNFELQPDSSIISPTIELNHKEGKFERSSLSSFLSVVRENLIYITETSLAHLANKNSIAGGMREVVRKVPEDKRRNKFVRYAFWSPLGEGGFTINNQIIPNLTYVPFACKVIASSIAMDIHLTVLL